ncbi:MAG: helix-turn-helix domain-containing protein [bacterium]|nr:helix-turn-helix domain-containing protein [bacterium]
MDERQCVTKTIKIIGSKWTVFILHELCAGKKRFGELQRALVGVSPKTLSQRLKELEKSGIVKKTVYPVVPLRVEYELTPRGQSFREIIDKMVEWGGREEARSAQGKADSN